MVVEIIKEREIVPLEELDEFGMPVVTAFEFQFPVDLETVAINRRLLGLDGGEMAPFTNKEKAILATDLRQKGFLTDDEVELIGGRIVKIEK